MRNTQLACIYYPTTTLLVDDSHRFLNHVALTLEKSLPYKLQNDPIQALDEFQQDNFNTLSSDVISTNVDSEDYGTFSEKYPLSLNISKLYRTVYDPKRFSRISVVVVDYAMPQMNGLEFCERLQGTNIKKIMLTGEADEFVAVSAFNKGLIDKFILKNQPEVGKVLMESIRQLQKRSFQDLSEIVIKGLASEPSSCVADPKFIQFFDKLCQDLCVTDYYLIDSSGSFLLLDAAGTPTWLIVKNEEEMEDFVIQAVETNAPASVIEALTKREKMVYFNNLHDYALVNGDQWEGVLHSAEKLEGTGGKEYFYCIVKELPTFMFESNKVVSLKDYMARHRH